MNNVTLKLDFQGVNHPGQVANPIHHEATAAILTRWYDLAEHLSERMKLPDSQHFKWYMHVGAGWKSDMEPHQAGLLGLADVTIWQKVPLGGEFAVTKKAEVVIMPELLGFKSAGPVTENQAILVIISRLEERE